MAERLRWVHAADPVRVAGEQLAARVADACRARGAARVAIPGGSALEAVGPARNALGNAWDRVRLTWVDERCVPLHDAASNRGAAYRRGALEASRPPAAELPLFADGERGCDAVVRVEAELARRFDGALDVLLLGVGQDGHVASLFPGFAPPPGARAAYVPSAPKPPPERITLTMEVLTTAGAAVLLATGEAKRGALARLARGDGTLVASRLVRALPDLVVVTDLHLEGGEEAS